MSQSEELGEKLRRDDDVSQAVLVARLTPSAGEVVSARLCGPVNLWTSEARW